MLPWISATAIDQRRALIAARTAGDATVAELARRFRVSRKTAHKFINRFKRHGDAGLHDLPRAPHNPRATSADLLIACEGLPRPTLAYVLPVVERAFQERGLPAVIRSDNGPPFASTGLGGLTAFAVHLVKLGVTPERITPGHPEQNGRIERFHRTLKEASMSPPAATLAAPSPAQRERGHERPETWVTLARKHR